MRAKLDESSTDSEPQNDHNVPADRWESWDLLQRLFFNLVYGESAKAFSDEGAPLELQSMSAAQRETAAFAAAWATTIRIEDAPSIRAAARV